MSQLGKLLMLLGGIIFLIGVWLAWGPRLPWLGKLPGDFLVKTGDFTIYIPLTTSLIISILLTLIFFIFQRLR